MKKKRIAIVTFYTENCKPYAELSDKSKQAYCDKYGFSYFVHKEQQFLDRHPVWEKPNALLAHFNEFDYIIWMDADACIANMEFDVSSIFKKGDTASIYMSLDCYGWNNGIFALKTDSVSEQFLKDVNASYEDYKTAVFKEQSCMGDLMVNKYLSNIRIVPVKTWNCYPDIYNHSLNNRYESGDFILHIPAANSTYRALRFLELNRKNKLVDL